MKKIIALLLAAIMLLSLAACTGRSDTNEQPSDGVSDENGTNDTSGTDDASGTDDVEGSEDPNELDAPEENTNGDTLGQILLKDFRDRIAADPDSTVQELADGIITNEAIQFMPETVPVEEGNLIGFTGEITGFNECIKFSPMISSIAFVGYIFKLDDGADVDAFMQTLKDNADLRWNICVAADEMIVEHEGNTVFFLMCPNSIGE